LKGCAILCLLVTPLGFTAGCRTPEIVSGPPAAPVLFSLAETRFSAVSSGRRSATFDLLATDMDLDGDPHLLVNRHHRGPLEDRAL